MGNTASERAAGERHGSKAARAEGAGGHAPGKEHRIMVGSTDDPGVFSLPDSKVSAPRPHPAGLRGAHRPEATAPCGFTDEGRGRRCRGRFLLPVPPRNGTGGVLASGLELLARSVGPTCGLRRLPPADRRSGLAAGAVPPPGRCGVCRWQAPPGTSAGRLSARAAGRGRRRLAGAPRLRNEFLSPDNL